MRFLIELLESDEKQHRAKIEFISRGNSRKGQFSTKKVKEALNKMGYEIEPVYDGNTLIQRVNVSGTREEIIKARTEITDRLRILSQGAISLRFTLLKDN